MTGTAADGVVLVVGPTAAGKSALAEHLAARVDGEIVSADALQVYRGLDVGTAKPSAAIRARIPHHCVDVFAPDERCTAGAYARCARAAIADVRRRGRVPIVAGGSGFYVAAALEGLDNLPRTDRRWRRALVRMAEARGADELERWLRRLDPAWASRIGPGDVQRLVRALEVVLRTGRRLAHQPGPEEPPVPVAAAVGLDWPRHELYRRIADRVDRMLASGWLEEVRGLLAAGLDPGAHSLQAIGYRQLAAVARGEMTPQEARREIVRATRRYAKRQMAWFRRDDRVRWFRVSREGGGDPPERVRELAARHVREALARTGADAAGGTRLVESD